MLGGMYSNADVGLLKAGLLLAGYGKLLNPDAGDRIPEP